MPCIEQIQAVSSTRKIPSIGRHYPSQTVLYTGEPAWKNRMELLASALDIAYN